MCMQEGTFPPTGGSEDGIPFIVLVPNTVKIGLTY